MAFILEERIRLTERNAIKRLAGFAKNGKVDLAAEWLVGRPKWVDQNEAWQVITEMNARIVNLAQNEFGGKRMPPHDECFPLGDFSGYLKNNNIGSPSLSNLSQELKIGRVVVGAKVINLNAELCDGSLFVTSSSFQNKFASWQLNRSAIIGGENVEVGKINCCLIICDGDCTIESAATNCLIICRGTVKTKPDAYLGGCHIISAKKISIPKNPGGFENKIKEKVAMPLGFFEFFDPIHVGLTTVQVREGLTVKSLEKGKPLASAGLQMNDCITAVDGANNLNLESFRLLLRQKVAMGAESDFRIRRGDQILNIKVSFAD